MVAITIIRIRRATLMSYQQSEKGKWKSMEIKLFILQSIFSLAARL